MSGIALSIPMKFKGSPSKELPSADIPDHVFGRELDASENNIVPYTAVSSRISMERLVAAVLDAGDVAAAADAEPEDDAAVMNELGRSNTGGAARKSRRRPSRARPLRGSARRRGRTWRRARMRVGRRRCWTRTPVIVAREIDLWGEKRVNARGSGD
jgi:hypothetical protein